MYISILDQLFSTSFIYVVSISINVSNWKIDHGPTMSLGPSENVRRKFSSCWKRKFLIWRRAKYSTTYSPTNDLSRRKKRRNVLHEKWLRRVKRKKFEYWPDIPSKFFNILFFLEKILLSMCAEDVSTLNKPW